MPSSRPAQPAVTLLYDTRLPVALRLRGLGLPAMLSEAASEVNVHFKQTLAASPHVLELSASAFAKPEIEAAGSIQQPRHKKRASETAAHDFDAFAKEFFSHLSLEEDLPSRLVAQDVDPKLLEGQLAENDLNAPRLHLMSRLPSRAPQPAIDLETVQEIEGDVAEIVEIVEKETKMAVQSSLKRLRSLRLPTLTLPALPTLVRARARHFAPPPLLHPSLRGVAVFVLLSFIFVLPLQAMQSRPDADAIKHNLLSGGTQAFALLKEGAQAAAEADFARAGSRFSEAGDELARSRTALSNLGLGVRTLAALLPSQGGALKTGEALVDLGYELSLSAERIGDGLAAIGNLTDASLGTKVEVLERYLASALPHLSAATDSLSRINQDLIPESHAETFAALSQTLPALEENLVRLEAFSGALKTILGNDAKKRYLFVFQNDTEIRPAGGFIGSFAEVDLYRGRIENIYLPGDGSYNLEGAQTLRVAAPKPLTLVNPRWEFQDANWFPDFEASAKKLLEFHHAAGGPTVDGVVAVNAGFVADLLKTLGPVDMPAYGRTITSDNFILETQSLVEIEYDREENRPKQFLADLAPELLRRVDAAEGSAFLPLMETLKRGLDGKDIQLYFTDPNLETDVRELGWAGTLTSTSGDYLMVVNANIGGQKTDAVIEEEIEVNSRLLPTRVENTVTITRRHHGIAGAPFTGANNVNYVQLFVPRGSRLLSVEGSAPPGEHLIETPDFALEEDADLAFLNASSFPGPGGATIGEYHGKTVFGSWTQTKPGQSSTITFVYESAARVEWPSEDATLLARAGNWLGLSRPRPHTLTLDPQSGMRERTVNVSISFPEERQPIWTTDLVEENRIKATIRGTETGFLGMLFE